MNFANDVENTRLFSSPKDYLTIYYYYYSILFEETNSVPFNVPLVSTGCVFGLKFSLFLVIDSFLPIICIPRIMEQNGGARQCLVAPPEWACTFAERCAADAALRKRTPAELPRKPGRTGKQAPFGEGSRTIDRRTESMTD